MCGFIAQLVEHRTGIAEVAGSNPVEVLIFFRLLLSNCLNWKIYYDDHSSLSSKPQFKYELFHMYFTLPVILHITKSLVKKRARSLCSFDSEPEFNSEWTVPLSFTVAKKIPSWSERSKPLVICIFKPCWDRISHLPSLNPNEVQGGDSQLAPE